VDPVTKSRVGADGGSKNIHVIPPVQAHYAAMHAQEETLRRRVPEALVLYHINLKLSHSGETAESMLKLDDRNFGTMFGQCMQITCDSGLVPYERDGTLRVVCQVQGRAGLLPFREDGSLPRSALRNSLQFRTEIEDTENIVSPPHSPHPILFDTDLKFLLSRPAWVPLRCRGGPRESSVPSK
jgi:hypothetical protein